MNDLLNRFDGGRDTGIENDTGYDHGAEILDPSIPERVLLVGKFSRQLCSDDRDDRRKRVRQVIDRVQDHRDRIGRNADGCFKGGQQNIGQYAYDAGPDDDYIPAQFRRLRP